MPKTVKSSSTGMHKFETLHSPSKRSPTVIKSHKDSDTRKIKTSSKVSFWGSPDSSSGVENLFKAMDLQDSSKSLIISMNLCSIKNMIQLFNLDLHEGVILVRLKNHPKCLFGDHQTYPQVLRTYLKQWI